MQTIWLDYIKKIQAIAQSGLAYSTNQYDLERYRELREISIRMMADLAHIPIEVISNLFANETGYQTPKVDVRGVIFADNQILLVKEKADGAWSLPGGWADIGLSPGEIAVKEVKEESGLDVKPLKLIAVLDKKCHKHPPSPYHTYKIFISCQIIGGELTSGAETSMVKFFDREHLPPLSQERNTAEQIRMAFDFYDLPEKEPVFD